MKSLFMGALLTLGVLCSCSYSRTYTVTQMGAMQKGDSPELVSLKIDHQPDLIGEAGDGEFHAYHRYLADGSVGGDVYTYDIYYFENGALVYWGTPDDFKVHSSEQIQSVGKEALKQILEEL